MRNYEYVAETRRAGGCLPDLTTLERSRVAADDCRGEERSSSMKFIAVWAREGKRDRFSFPLLVRFDSAQRLTKYNACTTIPQPAVFAASDSRMVRNGRYNSFKEGGRTTKKTRNPSRITPAALRFIDSKIWSPNNDLPWLQRSLDLVASLERTLAR